MEYANLDIFVKEEFIELNRGLWTYLKEMDITEWKKNVAKYPKICTTLELI